VDEFKNPSSSAPQSCSGSSGSDEDEDEGSGETEDMDHFEPSVSNGERISTAGLEVKDDAEESEVELLPEDKAENDEAENENDESCALDKALQSEDLTEEGVSTQPCAFVVGDEAGAEEGDEESSNEREAIVEGENSSRKASSDSDSNKEEAESQFNHWVHEKVSESNEGNDDEGQNRRIEENEITGDQPAQEKSELTEHNGSSEVSTTEDKATSQFKQENGEIKLKDLGEAKTQDPQISFHGATASMRISHSNVELGSMASSGTLSNGERSPERRRISRFLNRSTGNRTPKLNIFATAQARGRTLLPELRSKLSSFSQQVRSRSPRLNTKRPSLHGETNSQQKQRRRTCRTKIIEL